jgi:biotin carboxylase
MVGSARQHVALIYQHRTLPWVFDEAAARGIDITLVPSPGDRTKGDPRDTPAVVDVLPLDIFEDYEGAIAALAARHRERPFDGVVTLREPAVPFTADLAERLGLPGIGREVALAARDKAEMRKRFRTAELNSPRYVYLTDPARWDEARTLTFPVVVKPAGGFSSQGVIRVDRAEDLPAAIARVTALIERDLKALARTDQRDFTGILIEEYLDGPEYAVETFALDGRVEVLSIGYKGYPTGPYFEEGVYIAPAPLAAETRAAVVDQVTRATLALGIANGPTHTEIRLRGGTTPYVLEIGARLGGAGVSHFIVSRSRGVSLVGLVLALATGAPPAAIQQEMRAGTSKWASNYIVQCGGHGKILRIDGLEEIRRHPDVADICQFLFPGDVVPPYPEFAGYPAFVLAQHSSYEDATEFHELLDRSVQVTYA